MMEKPINQARLAIARLERLSPDSIWARRASGCRGTLLRLMENLETRGEGDLPDLHPADLDQLRQALNLSFDILEGAAQEHLRRKMIKY